MLIRIHPADNVGVNPENGHKYALTDIARGDKVIKYGFPIGSATANIKAGEHVHTHNLATCLTESAEYVYAPDYKPLADFNRMNLQSNRSGYIKNNGLPSS